VSIGNPRSWRRSYGGVEPAQIPYPNRKRMKKAKMESQAIKKVKMVRNLSKL